MAVHRIEVWDRFASGGAGAGGDLGVLTEALAGLGRPVSGASGSLVYLVEAEVDAGVARGVAEGLLADPVDQEAVLGARSAEAGTVCLEVHDLPGVMDPAAETARSAIAERLGVGIEGVRVRTGRRVDLRFTGEMPEDQVLIRAAERSIANPVVERVRLGHEHPETLALGRPYAFELRRIPLSGLDDAALKVLSREQHLFLSVAEMRTIQTHFAELGREPTDIELETLAQTWSEHCVHKTLKSAVRYTGFGREWLASLPGAEADGDAVLIPNLLKHSVAAATFELMEETELGDWCVSVFHDNSGVVRFDDEDGVCIKVETHNHPSALEPYGGAATGIGGCIRDIIGTGLAARPVANTDVFCVARPEVAGADLPAGVIHPKQILRRVVEGVRDYGNRMGIPTVNGAVAFDPDYVGNPLVFAGCVGLIPLDRVEGEPGRGDRIIAVGGATGRDGIHGATFSSAELTDAHAEEFSHAVQIGNPITQKKLLDAIMAARDWVDPATGSRRCLYSAITDCGAGGFSSAIGEMGEKIGASVELDRAPLKYDGLSYTEIWISEAQERMVLAVPAADVEAFGALCDAEGAAWCDLGEFGVGEVDSPELVLNYGGVEVGRMSMDFLHDGVPKTERAAHGEAKPERAVSDAALPIDRAADLMRLLLGHPTIASKHWIIRQYDHEVQGGSVVKPLTGVAADGPSDAAVIRPKLGSRKAVALGGGLAPQLSEKSVERGTSTDGDAYHAVLAAIDEAVRNVVCVGADPGRVAILDNFCWPSCDDPSSMASLARAAAACYHGAKAYGTPFVSGKDSLHNQFTTEDGRLITIPSTMLITAMGMVTDAGRCVTSDAKSAGSVLVLVGPVGDALGGSHLAEVAGLCGSVPKVDLAVGPRTARAVAGALAGGKVLSAHDVSDGGLAVSSFEMAMGGRLGVKLDLSSLAGVRWEAALFGEGPSRYVLEVDESEVEGVLAALTEAGAEARRVGVVTEEKVFEVEGVMSASMAELRGVWLGVLDW
ncbi:phosphoribosylformylglycinamidine synthase subunit PurS [Mucisphaera calidilacus]|uniref:Phosphoribosylformylglycinamidine synthase subunit PurL n=1 Tax=Mucisphaera calidilacus TaxID=2527982 RepID=A0A518BYJ7_9BACT|nr:phosphoribosylformylglycinamidine synthase subunit PurS [Mucisphaera calidilacus]QDU72049.1 Phosphoribosylformylglycinamidine synthase subunit PurL [Mucisphaera calidilacus]